MFVSLKRVLESWKKWRKISFRKIVLDKLVAFRKNRIALNCPEWLKPKKTPIIMSIATNLIYKKNCINIILVWKIAPF